MSDDVFMGYVTGKLRFQVPPSELAKVNPKTYNFKSDMAPIPSGGGQEEGGSGLNQDKERKKSRLFGDVISQMPMGKGLVGLTKILGPLGAVLALLSASSGLRELLGAFFDLIGLIADLIFIAILPVLRPLLDGFIKIAKAFVSRSGGPGGILAALLDPTLFQEIALVIVTALLSTAAQLVQLFADIMDGAAALIAGKNSSGMGELFGGLMGDAVGAFLDIISAFFAVGAAGFNLMSALLQGIMNNVDAKAFSTSFADSFMTAVKPHLDKLKESVSSYFEAGSAFARTFLSFIVWVFESIFVRGTSTYAIFIQLAVDMGLAIAQALADAVRDTPVGNFLQKVGDTTLEAGSLGHYNSRTYNHRKG